MNYAVISISFLLLISLSSSTIPAFADDVCKIFCQGQGHTDGSVNSTECTGEAIGDCCCS